MEHYYTEIKSKIHRRISIAGVLLSALNMMNDPSKSISDISPDGDVVLIVGQKKARLRVQARCLSAASTVFRAMLGNSWKEGSQLSHEVPTEVPLDEDDVQSMRVICCVLHHRNDLVPESIPAADVLEIAIAADKYNLTTALLFASPGWLKPKYGETMIAELNYLMVAAYLLQDQSNFSHRCYEMIAFHVGSYARFLDDPQTKDFIPSKVYLLLEEQRNNYRTSITELLMAESYNCLCGWERQRSDLCRATMVALKPKEILETSIYEAFIKKLHVPIVEEKARVRCNVSSIGQDHLYHDPRPSLHSKMTDMTTSTRIYISDIKGSEN